MNIIRVLIVDDSRFICKRIREILEEDSTFRVIGVAGNGQEAIDLALRLHPDVITMDVEMPVMDGITAVKKIMELQPCPILMFSALTQFGAKATLDALNAGAIDFLPKQLNEIDDDRKAAKSVLRSRVRIVASSMLRRTSNCSLGSVVDDKVYVYQESAAGLSKRASRELGKIDLLAIAASTGGPVAIQKVLREIPSACSVPIILIQHMPQNFTRSFAERLDQLCHIKVKEAEDNEFLQAGTAILAPGGMQMVIKESSGRQRVVLRPKQPGEIYSPCIDITFESLALEFKGRVLVVVLTGMGADGREGATKLKLKGAEVWAQDESSSTIYGMPKAIAEANIADKIYSLDEIAHQFKKLV